MFCVHFERSKSFWNLKGQIIKICPDIFKDVFAGKFVELNRTARREMREIEFHFPVNGKAVPWQERLEFGISPVSAVCLTDEVEHGETILLWCMAKTPAQLLKEDGQTLRGAKKEDCVYLRHINTFAQFIDGEEKGKSSRLQIIKQSLAAFTVNTGDKGTG